MSKLTEDYFNDKNITSDEITQEIEQTSDNYMPYKFLVSIDNFYDDNYKKVSITAQQYKEILKRVFIFCKHSDMFDEFEIELGYSTDEGIDYIGLTEPNAIRKTLKLLFVIRFKVESVPNFKLFVMSIQKLTTLIYLLISERFKLRIAQNGFTLKEATYS